jgi:hypothetical protein
MAEALETQGPLPVQTGIQESPLKLLDSGFRRNDERKKEWVLLQTFSRK